MTATPGNPPTTTRQATHVNGVEVLAREAAIGPHPHFGAERPGPMEGVTKLLLADGSEIYSCDGCDFTHPTNPVAVRSHRNTTHRRTTPPGPLTSVATIKAVIRAVEQAKLEPGRDYAERAAAELTAARVPSVHNGTQWNAAQVSGLYRKYREKYPVRIPRQVKTDRARTKLPEQPTSPPRADDDPVAKAINLTHHAVVLLNQALSYLDRIEVAPADPDLVEKARKYDQLRGLIS